MPAAAPAPAPADLTGSLQRLFGFPAFRPGQEDLVRRALAGRDCLAVMPTGSGKSLCYQLPAMLRPTPTLVLSPLIALMKDQVEHVPAPLRDRVTFINSSLEAAEAGERLRAVAAGRVKLLYAAPERLRQGRFADALRAARIGMVVVDEAHCVALWGHDFRPDYLFIRSALGGPLRQASLMAMTATATPRTAEEIRRALGRDMEVVRFSVVRENLRYDVVRLADEEAKLRYTLQRAAAWSGSGIIYVRARERCERLAAFLRQRGVAAAHYHALVDRRQRAETQEAFLAGGIRVVVATTAFGMGVDKPDIRWVLLYNYPTSLEQYVQQVGRAGRDGQPSRCVLLATPGDAANLRAFARRDAATVDELRRVWSALRVRGGSGAGADAEAGAEELAAAADLPEGKDPRVHCGILERVGLIERHFDAGRSMRFTLLPPPADAASRIAELVGAMQAEASQRTRRMVAFAEARECRHLQVARHFGDALVPPCDRCDVCAPGDAAAAPAEAAPTRELPADPARTILDAVAALTWPLGQRGLIALLRGSAAASPSARRSPAYGVLEAASTSAVRRWLQELVDGGYLIQEQSDGGYPILVRGRRDDPPALSPTRRTAANRGARSGAAAAASSPAADPLLTPEEKRIFTALRTWRAEEARRAQVPAYVVLHDRSLREVARSLPRSLHDLAAISGIGPAKIDNWGEALIALLRRESPPEG